ncbi:unnamed protein product [Trichogramma brassicae]|uniref:CTP synthase N-terminal domain-containing protein n=1 Tax=Trichogramma brassicae TaxID=86971 RepID=A0A6H5J2U0_9HYME|nr:unnamed protein product [Trichogramma brassicae]
MRDHERLLYTNTLESSQPMSKRSVKNRSCCRGESSMTSEPIAMVRNAQKPARILSRSRCCCCSFGSAHRRAVITEDRRSCKHRCTKIFKSSRENVNWEILDERRKFIHQVDPSLERWSHILQSRLPPPNIQDVFRSEEIECLDMDYINFVDKDKQYINELGLFITFLAYSGYKDEPELDGDGKPSSRRTTPVHHAAKQGLYITRELFQIYNRYDVNYTDESGLSHFHVACKYSLKEEIKKFLELGHDSNCIDRETGNSPLHMYLIGNQTIESWEMNAEPLFRKVIDLNLANKDGLTPLHIISQKSPFDWLLMFYSSIPNAAKLIFEISDKLNQPLQIDARDKFGNTPLHVAVFNNNVYAIEMLLRRGVDPKLTNDEGSTPLHEFYKRVITYDDMGSLELFFKICDELNHLIQVDAKDKLGRTPLQLAVANLWPDCIDILFERGADLSRFIFPTDSYFAERYNKSSNKITSNCRLRLASSALAVVEKIENRGYQLKRSDALTIMKFFAEYKLFEKSTDLEKCWYDNEKFIKKAKEIWICPGTSIQSYYNKEKIKTSPSLILDEVVRLQPEEAAKLLTYEDYWKFACPYYLMNNLNIREKDYEELTALNLCEKLSRGFFLSWALDPFMELTHHRLPILCSGSTNLSTVRWRRRAWFNRISAQSGPIPDHQASNKSRPAAVVIQKSRVNDYSQNKKKFFGSILCSLCNKMKYILVTGGVISGVGKGVIASSFGAILKSCGLHVTSIKIDPYLNIDAGTFSPYEHGEVYVLDDGGEPCKSLTLNTTQLIQICRPESSWQHHVPATARQRLIVFARPATSIRRTRAKISYHAAYLLYLYRTATTAHESRSSFPRCFVHRASNASLENVVRESVALTLRRQNEVHLGDGRCYQWCRQGCHCQQLRHDPQVLRHTRYIDQDRPLPKHRRWHLLALRARRGLRSGRRWRGRSRSWQLREIPRCHFAQRQ